MPLFNYVYENKGQDMACLKVTGKCGSQGSIRVRRRAYTAISESLEKVMNSKRE